MGGSAGATTGATPALDAARRMSHGEQLARNVSFRYFGSGSPFEYDLVRFLYTKKRELELRVGTEPLNSPAERDPLPAVTEPLGEEPVAQAPTGRPRA